MLPEKNILRTIRKQKRLAEVLDSRLFTTVGKVNIRGVYQTTEALHSIPDDSFLSPLPEKWGGAGVYAWFKGDYTVPEELDGKVLYAYPRGSYYEGTLWVNGAITTNYATKIKIGCHGNHYSKRFTGCAKAGEHFEFALELYAYHIVPGTQPYSCEILPTYFYDTADLDICVRDDELMHFIYDIRTLIGLHEILPENSYERCEIENTLYDVHLKLFYDPDACTEAEFRAGIRAAREIMAGYLSRKNAPNAPYIGLTGHSHMDTAWLWPVSETIKKCARTYSHQLQLMEEYPEYRFIQAASCHSDMIRRNYPELFERIRQRVAEGRYEPNGGAWVECDCNLTGAEYLVRQFVWGQRFNRKYFNYTSDCFWLPDTFGYAWSIPQIMHGCDIKYFLTSKIDANDTNRFPYTSFWWQGLDGTRVLTHFTTMGSTPDPWTFEYFSNCKERRVSPMRLISYGQGDGGGGPTVDDVEGALRLADLAGVPRSSHISASEFMNKLEENLVHPSVHAGELYLETHRATLTSMHEIKRNNRMLEMALHDLELAAVRSAVKNGSQADNSAIHPLTETLLLHQFHDILPGTSIHCVHDETRAAITSAIETARATEQQILSAGSSSAFTLMNTTSFDRAETLHIPAKGASVEGCIAQAFTTLDGENMLAVHGLNLPALGGCTIEYSSVPCSADSPFTVEGNVVTTPFARVTFDDNGGIASLIDLSLGRELVGGLPFNTFLLGEDIPEVYDNWDLDLDHEEKFRPAGKLISREIVSCGAVELRMRCAWNLSDNLSIRQDIVFDAFSPMITFDTEIDWSEAHRFLKTAFETSLTADGMRSEIQFGNIRRSNHRSTSLEKARFEVCNHKYSDMSESTCGIAILNDCKYGISSNEGGMYLSLHKGGMLPDPKGDWGVHRCRYAILPHAGAFSAENVIRPAYAFNYAPVVVQGKACTESLLHIDKANIIAETIKPCEDVQRAYILRLYEAEGGWTKANIAISHPYTSAKSVNMLEENEADIDLSALAFRPFEIKTIKVYY